MYLQGNLSFDIVVHLQLFGNLDWCWVDAGHMLGEGHVALLLDKLL